jgi:hypothetical protein
MQPKAGQGWQIGQVFTGRDGGKAMGGLRLPRGKGGPHLFAHFKRCRPDTRTQPSYYFYSILYKLVLRRSTKRRINRLDDALPCGITAAGQPPPAGMGGGNPGAVQ